MPWSYLPLHVKKLGEDNSILLHRYARAQHGIYRFVAHFAVFRSENFFGEAPSLTKGTPLEELSNPNPPTSGITLSIVIFMSTRTSGSQFSHSMRLAVVCFTEKRNNNRWGASSMESVELPMTFHLSEALFLPKIVCYIPCKKKHTAHNHGPPHSG